MFGGIYRKGAMLVDIKSYFESLTLEFEALRDRVRNFINDAHWLTDGEWKECVFRSFLVRHLPEAIGVGRGFVLTANGPTSQCDIILYNKSAPVLFKDGELVFLTTDAVLGIIEVKTRTNPGDLRDILKKFAAIGAKFSDKWGQPPIISRFSEAGPQGAAASGVPPRLPSLREKRRCPVDGCAANGDATLRKTPFQPHGATHFAIHRNPPSGAIATDSTSLQRHFLRYAPWRSTTGNSMPSEPSARERDCFRCKPWRAADAGRPKHRRSSDPARGGLLVRADD